MGHSSGRIRLRSGFTREGVLSRLDLRRRADVAIGEIRFVLDGRVVGEPEFVEGVNAGEPGHIEFNPADEDRVMSEVLGATGGLH